MFSSPIYELPSALDETPVFTVVEMMLFPIHQSGISSMIISLSSLSVTAGYPYFFLNSDRVK